MSADDADATIVALSSGSPPAAIGIVRVSGRRAGDVLAGVAGSLPAPRRATLRTIRDPRTGHPLDRALLLWFPGPSTATGEDLAEIHAHGGRAVIAAVIDAVAAMPGVRRAEPGEFTRRAFANGVIDLAQAEGLADLLSAETEQQRRNALQLASGAFSRKVAGWQAELLTLSAQVEAEIEYGDEDGAVVTDVGMLRRSMETLAEDIERSLTSPPAERLKEGVRVVIAGPPNVGKSTLLNALVGRDAAIVSEIAGTTRDLVEVPVQIGGQPFLFVDTAGLRPSSDPIENIGIDRAGVAMASADVVLWLGDPDAAPHHATTILVHPRSDLDLSVQGRCDISVSAVTGKGMHQLLQIVQEAVDGLLPAAFELALNSRQRTSLARCHVDLIAATAEADPVLCAGHLGFARAELNRLTGKSGTEEMLDSLFQRFCIGK